MCAAGRFRLRVWYERRAADGALGGVYTPTQKICTSRTPSTATRGVWCSFSTGDSRRVQRGKNDDEDAHDVCTSALPTAPRSPQKRNGKADKRLGTPHDDQAVPLWIESCPSKPRGN
jgi:hypothetical protein